MKIAAVKYLNGNASKDLQHIIYNMSVVGVKQEHLCTMRKIAAS